ncbi:hypothetical protein ICW40_03865 [Actinotalea ferrariae]|nr:hypothetical protein [Actinotalea ferrariae]
MPVGALGVAAAGVVVAAAVGVAGVLGAFSSDETSTEPTPITAPSEPAPTADDEPVGPGEDLQASGGAAQGPADAESGATGTDEGTGDPAGDDPADDGAGSADETADEPAGSSGTGTGAADPTTDPGTQPQPQPAPEPEPEPEPVDPPAVRIPSLPAVTLTAGVPGALELEISNEGGAFTGTVRADFRFDEGTDWSVVAVPETVDGGGAARTAAGATDWTCAPADAVTASCVRDGLEARSTTSLNVHLSVVDPDVDGVRDLPVGIRAWTPGHGAEPEFTTVTAQVASPPARLVAGAVTAPAAFVAGTPGVVTVPVQNIGRTSVPATATVDLPPDVTGAPVAGSPWTCAPAPGDASLLTCDVARLARGESSPLVLDAVADPAIRNRAAPGAVTATVGAVGLDPAVADAATVTVRSAPAHYAIALERSGAPAPGPIDAVVRLTNSGGTDGYPTVQALLPRGFRIAPAGQGWECTPNADGTTLCTNDGSALPARDLVVRADGQATVPIRLVAPPGQVTGGRHHVTVNLREGGAVGESVTFPVDVVHPADLSTSSVSLAAEVGHTSPLAVVVANTGGVADDVAVVVTLPTGMVPVDSTGWTAVTGDTFERSVTVGAGSTRHVTMTVRSAMPSAAVDRTVSVELRGAAGAGGLIERPVRLVPPPAVLAATTSLDVAQTQGDQTATVRFDVTNSGFGRAAGVALSATLPPGVVPADASGWSCTNGATRTCSRTVTVEPGATASWTLQVRGAVDAPRDVALTTRVSHRDFSVTGSHALRVAPAPVPACAAAWQFGRTYAVGDLVTYGGRLYERQVTSISLLPPPVLDSRWTDLGPCA